jgi:hypothetical protein
MRIPVQAPKRVRGRFAARIDPAREQAWGIRPSQMDDGEEYSEGEEDYAGGEEEEEGYAESGEGEGAEYGGESE